MTNENTYKRKLVISDIHGCYNEFKLLLNKVHYNTQEDELILLGDYVDRGLQSKLVIELIRQLYNEYDIKCLKGNHEQMFLDSILNNEDEDFINNGGFSTIESYVGYDWFTQGYNQDEFKRAKEFIKEHYSHHIEFLSVLPLYYETEEYLFVHAGINRLYEDWRKQPISQFLWVREMFYNRPTLIDKTVVFGHTPTIQFHNSPDIWIAEDKIGIDGGCAYGYQLNCLEITADSYKKYFVKRGESLK